jgi:hypothetical protein
MLDCHINGAGVWGPGLSGWEVTREILRGNVPYRATETLLPVPGLLPATERRRSSAATRLALGVAQEAVTRGGVEVKGLPTVFGTSVADAETIHVICETLAGAEREVSPTRFHNSVFNAAAGYWSIGTGSHAASTTICAYDAGFAAALLEAMVQCAAGAEHVLLVVYDVPCPYPLSAVRPIDSVFGVSLLLGRDALASCVGRLSAAVEPCRPASPLEDPALEALRLGNPSARALPLLLAMARQAAAELSLEYVTASSVSVRFAPSC